jgi:hypothetical protein
MPEKNPQQKRAELIATRRQELLNLGYTPGIVEKAMIWAESCAEGLVGYAQRADLEDAHSMSKMELANQFLPQFLADAEKYMRAFDHERGEHKSQNP